MITDEDVSLTENIAKLVEANNQLLKMNIQNIKADQTNRLHAASTNQERAMQSREERRKHSSMLQRNMIGLATGGQVIPSYDDDDDIAPKQNDHILIMHGASSVSTKQSGNTDEDKVTKSYKLMKLITGGGR